MRSWRAQNHQYRRYCSPTRRSLFRGPCAQCTSSCPDKPCLQGKRRTERNMRCVCRFFITLAIYSDNVRRAYQRQSLISHHDAYRKKINMESKQRRLLRQPSYTSGLTSAYSNCNLFFNILCIINKFAPGYMLQHVNETATKIRSIVKYRSCNNCCMARGASYGSSRRVRRVYVIQIQAECCDCSRVIRTYVVFCQEVE